MRSSKAVTRRFEDFDLAAVSKLICDAIDHSYIGAYTTQAIYFFKDYHKTGNILDDSRRGLTIVIEIDGRIVATGTLLGDEIKRMFVSPDMQGMGLGRDMMGVLLQRAREKGLSRIFLDSSVVSNGFYLKCGLQQISENFILLDDGSHLDYARMTLTLK
ncbi:MAG: GNAT family N-acetyltransferase [Methanomassiliicoccales archaeon]